MSMMLHRENKAKAGRLTPRAAIGLLTSSSSSVIGCMIYVTSIPGHFKSGTCYPTALTFLGTMTERSAAHYTNPVIL